MAEFCKDCLDILSVTNVFVPPIGNTSQRQKMVGKAWNMRKIQQRHTDHSLPKSKGKTKTDFAKTA